jgi:type IV pilus assembly protein PilE
MATVHRPAQRQLRGRRHNLTKGVFCMRHHLCTTTRRRVLSGTRLARGFTLIELMITVAIVGILIALAYPRYTDYVIRGALADGPNGLAAMRANMERHFQDNRTYATVGTFTTPCSAGDTASRTVGKFVISCVGTPNDSEFTIQAAGSGQVNGFTYTINQAGTQTTVGPWWTDKCNSKWLMKKGDTC